MIKSRWQFAILPVALLSASMLSGCAQVDPTSSLPSQEASQSQDIEAPAFSGIWASDFTDAYHRTVSEFERQVLADGSISDSEFAEMENGFKSCLEDQGIAFDGFKQEGGFNFHFPEGMGSDSANELADKCSASSGNNTVGRLHFAMQRNPQKLDEATLMAECLVVKQVVPKGYSASDYNKDAPTFVFPFKNKDAGGKAYDECAADPLGLLGQSQ